MPHWVSIDTVTPHEDHGGTHYVKGTVQVEGQYHNPPGSGAIDWMWVQPDSDPHPRGKWQDVSGSEGTHEYQTPYHTTPSGSWPQEFLPDGAQTLTAHGYADDKATHLAQSSAYPITVDNTDPECAFVDLGDGDWVSPRSDQPIDVAYSDNMGVVRLELYVDSAPPSPPQVWYELSSPETQGQYCFTIDTSGWDPESGHILSLVVYDVAENSTQQSISVYTGRAIEV